MSHPVPRYNTITTIPDTLRVDTYLLQPEKDYGEYIVDDSYFVPMSEAVKNVTSGAVSPEALQGMYDFKDGVDTGMKIPVDRSHRFTGDIAEVSKAVREAEAGAVEELKEARRQFDFEQKMNELNGNSVSESSDNSQ